MSHFEKKHNLLIIVFLAYVLFGLAVSSFNLPYSQYLNLFYYLPQQFVSVVWGVIALLSVFILYQTYKEWEENG